MLQQNNNNNYSCLERACSSGEVLQERDSSILPFAKLLEMGSFPELGDVSHRGPIRGFRAWAMNNMCSRSRRWATLPPGNQVPPCLKRPDAVASCQTGNVAGNLQAQKGRLVNGQNGVGLGFHLDARTWSGVSGGRQGGLGALVTVATLKASERGGQTQTQCFLLRAKGRSYLCAAGKRRIQAPGPSPEVPPTQRAGDTVASSQWIPTGGKGSKQQREGGGASRVKPRPIRKWRTSSEAALSSRGRASWESEGREFPSLEESQENKAKQASRTSGQDTSAQQQGSRGTETCGTTPVKICTHCRGVRDTVDISPRRAAEDRDQPSSGREGEGIASPISGSCVCHLRPDPSASETVGSNIDQGEPANAGMQEGPQAKSAAQKIGRFQDLLGDKSPRLGTSSKGEATRPVLNTADLEYSSSDNGEEKKEFKAAGEMRALSDNDSEGCRTNDTADGREGGGGGLPCDCVTADAPEGPSCEEAGPAERGLAHPAVGCDGLNGDEHAHRLEKLSSPLDQGFGSAEAGDLCQGKTLVGMGRGEREQTAGLLVEPCLETGNRTNAGSHPGVCPGDSCDNRAGTNRTEEAGPPEVHSHKQAESRGPHRGQDRVKEPQTEPSSPALGGEGRWSSEAEDGEDLIWQPCNSLSRGLDSAAAVTTHALPNPAPPGAMATARSAPGGRLAEAGGGGTAAWPSPGEQQQHQQGWQGGMVASGEGSLDVEQDGEDDFGLFVRAGEQLSWDDSFSAFYQVPCGTGESAEAVNESEPSCWSSGKTDNLFHQSEDAWTAFSQEGGAALDPGLGGRQQTLPAGQWWPQNAVEELSTKLPASLDVFQSRLSENYFRACLVMTALLETDHMTRSRLDNDNPSAGLLPFTQQTPTMGNGKARLSYDINKNVLA
ncbi:hypothetical protein JZ751_021347 [Albula glossodonta]|uniref:Aftiphilin n=1 Tax=Albula glossodonta TaxID=121402 RepID=A0A8T2NVV9_9TELE|nr:hypothetical protein JZ751_021347 [Albula glossodonta]